MPGGEGHPEGAQIRSRYYPVHSYAVWSNDRPWAWCPDKPCIVDKNNPEAASCAEQLHSKHLHDRGYFVGDGSANNPGNRLPEDQDQSADPVQHLGPEKMTPQSGRL